MHSIQFTSTTSVDGVLERDFRLGDITGVLWSHETLRDGAPLLLMGHGAGLHARHPGVAGRARLAVSRQGFTVTAIDAPGHGRRTRTAEDQALVDSMRRARSAREPIATVVSAFNASIAQRAVPEWQATIAALQLVAEVGSAPRIGFQGMTLGSEIGIRLAAVDPRVTAGVFGGVYASDALLAAAATVRIPVEVLLPWDDPDLDRESGLALFDAFASSDKTLHAFPGDHFRVPEAQIDTGFFQRHLRSLTV